MISLPTLRRKILRSFSLLVGLYAILGLLLVMAIQITSKTSPKLLHVNYDSISASQRMTESWTALQYPAFSAKSSRTAWIQQFDEALRFEQGNITEPGEKEITAQISAEWENAKPSLGSLPAKRFEAMIQHLKDLITLNEKGMFGLAQENTELSRQVMIGTLIYFALSLVLSLLFADSLSQRISRPLKNIAESLHRRPGVHGKLRLPEPTNLEVLILNTELTHLWERLAQSERVNVDEILKQKGKLETLLESVEDALLVVAPEGRVTHCNECLAKLVGLTREEIQGQKWSDLPTLNENYLKLRSILHGEMSYSQQIELTWKQTQASFSARSKKIGTGNHDQTETLFLLHDITEKKQREKFRSDFIDLLSHELKTPLQSLGTASELLCQQKEQLPEELRLMADTISDDVERIRAVAQEFVQITQSQAKIMKLKMEMVAVNQILPEWIKPFSVIAKDRGVKIEFHKEGSEVIWANLDLVKFPWVISNILSNAVRFSPAQSNVTVLLSDRGGEVEIRIRDQGPGISEDEQRRMFEPYYQGGAANTSGARGFFGIGLTIAKEVVEAHEGRIEYHRIQPQGSEFRVLLPFPPLQYGKTPPTGDQETKSWTH